MGNRRHKWVHSPEATKRLGVSCEQCLECFTVKNFHGWTQDMDKWHDTSVIRCGDRAPFGTGVYYGQLLAKKDPHG